MVDADRAPLDVERLRVAATGLWQRLDVVAETGSTNADLLARSVAGDDIAGAVLLAEYQRAGRGRHGRTWTAAPRSQITMSVGVDASGIPPEAWGWLPLLTGLAVVDAVRAGHPVEPGLKWPNDVLVGTGKLAGILAEVASPLPVIVVGIGLNVTLTAREAPDTAATSLSMLGCPAVDRTDLAGALLNSLGSRISRWQSAGGADAGLLADYRRASLTLGTVVRAFLPGDREIVGVARAVDDAGRLVIDDGSANVTISAGDITHLRPATDSAQ